MCLFVWYCLCLGGDESFIRIWQVVYDPWSTLRAVGTGVYYTFPLDPLDVWPNQLVSPCTSFLYYHALFQEAKKRGESFKREKYWGGEGGRWGGGGEGGEGGGWSRKRDTLRQLLDKYGTIFELERRGNIDWWCGGLILFRGLWLTILFLLIPISHTWYLLELLTTTNIISDVLFKKSQDECNDMYNAGRWFCLPKALFLQGSWIWLAWNLVSKGGLVSFIIGWGIRLKSTVFRSVQIPQIVSQSFALCVGRANILQILSLSFLAALAALYLVRFPDPPYAQSAIFWHSKTGTFAKKTKSKSDALQH